jgi:hypothetical protein
LTANVDSIEPAGLTKKAQKLENKHVEVVGKLSHRHGVEQVFGTRGGSQWQL